MLNVKSALPALACLVVMVPAAATATPSESSVAPDLLSRVWGCPDGSIPLIDGQIGLGDGTYRIIDGPPYYPGKVVTVCDKARCGKARVLGCVPLALEAPASPTCVA